MDSDNTDTLPDRHTISGDSKQTVRPKVCTLPPNFTDNDSTDGKEQCTVSPSPTSSNTLNFALSYANAVSGKKADPLPLSRIHWTPGFAISCAAVFIIANLLLVIGMKPEWLTQYVVNARENSFSATEAPTRIYTPASPDTDSIITYSTPAYTPSQSGAKDVAITENEKEVLIEQLNSAHHRTIGITSVENDDKYETYIKPSSSIAVESVIP